MTYKHGHCDGAPIFHRGPSVPSCDAGLLIDPVSIDF